jgi:DNA-binding transcriptional LysR family regulator
VTDDLASHSLVRLLPEYEPLPLPVQIVTPSARHLAAKTRAFVDHATRAFASLEVIRRWA